MGPLYLLSRSLPGVDECPHAWYRIYPSAERHAKMHVVMTPQLLNAPSQLGKATWQLVQIGCGEGGLGGGNFAGRMKCTSVVQGVFDDLDDYHRIEYVDRRLDPGFWYVYCRRAE